MMCGGTGEVKPADEEVQKLTDAVKPFLEEQSGKKFEQFKAISHKTQVVAGTNYFIKVQVAESQFVHLRVFKPLPHCNAIPELSAYQLDKSSDDAIEYFDKA